jgi:predicted  nucleic acid-binding Zn-ribbon protein
MNSVVAYRSPEAVIYPGVLYEDAGDFVDQILKRLDGVEADISVLKADVSELKFNVREIFTAIANLVTKKELSDLKGELKGEIKDLRGELKGEIKDLRGELKGEIKDLRTEMASMEAKIIKWIIATGLATAGLAFAAAKFIH